MVDLRPVAKILESGPAARILEEGAVAGKSLLSQAGDLLMNSVRAPKASETVKMTGFPPADAELLAAIRQAQHGNGVAAPADFTKMAKKPFARFDHGGYKHVEPRVPEHGMGSGNGRVPFGGSDAALIPEDPFRAFDQSGYKWVAARTLAMDIRTAQGPTLSHSDKIAAPGITFGENGIHSIRIPSNFTSDQKAETMMVAGYAGLIKTDAAAAKSVSLIEKDAIGFLSRKVEAHATPEQMEQTAIAGAEAYIKNQSGNAYTAHLIERFGPGPTPDEVRHVLGDMAGAQSALSSTIGPATERLLRAGIPITEATRAAAANPAILSMAPWHRSGVFQDVPGLGEAINKIVSVRPVDALKKP